MNTFNQRLAGWWLIALLSSISFSPLAESELHLIEAAKSQDWVRLSVLLKEGVADINTTQPDGTTALAWAVYWDHGITIAHLLDAGADPNIANDIGVTPLILAIKNRSHSVVNALLEQGADPNATLWDGVTPLMTAARTGVTSVIKTLLAHEAAIDARDPRRGQTALMWAISAGQPEGARILIESGADINARSKMLTEDGLVPMVLQGYMENVVVTPQGGYTALMFAARVGDLATARLLLERGVNINETHGEDGPAIVIAAAGGYEELALYLLGQGADPNIADANGMTALHYAMRDGIKVLHGFNIIDVTRVCGFGDEVTRCKPLSIMTMEDRAMLDNPLYGLFVVEPKKKDPNAPLSGSNMHELAEALLADGADPDVRMKYPPPRLRLEPVRNSLFNTRGATPFLLATAALDLTAMDLLLEYGADPMRATEIDEESFARQTNIHGSRNQIIGNANPLMVAAGMGRRGDLTPEEEQMAYKAVEKLLGMGADVNATTVAGWTALHAAVYIGANSLVELLMKNGARLDVANGCGRTPINLARGETALGLLDSAISRPDMVELLLSLGADETSESDPVGQCVLGREGLEIETELQNRIRAIQQQQPQ